jgi:dCTP deaminase
MLLSDRDIRAKIADGSLIIGAGDPRIRPASVLLHLGREFQMHQGLDTVIDPSDPPPMHAVHVDEYIDILPGAFLLGHTVEAVGFPADLAGQVDGRSSLARLGLQVHQTAGHVDPGFQGQITLELHNVASRPIRLRPGMSIVKLNIIYLSSACESPYGSPGVESMYQGQAGATSARTPVFADKHEPPAYPAESLEWNDYYSTGGW